MKWSAAVAVPCIVALCVLAGVSVAPAAVNMQEGNWEMTIKVKLEGLPFAMPPMTVRSTQCITKKDMVPKTSGKDQKCQITDQKESGNTVTWKITCTEKDGSTSVGEGTVTYSGNTLAGKIRTTMKDKKGKNASTSTTEMTGKRTGDCAK